MPISWTLAERCSVFFVLSFAKSSNWSYKNLIIRFQFSPPLRPNPSRSSRLIAISLANRWPLSNDYLPGGWRSVAEWLSLIALFSEQCLCNVKNHKLWTQPDSLSRIMPSTSRGRSRFAVLSLLPTSCWTPTGLHAKCMQAYLPNKRCLSFYVFW